MERSDILRSRATVRKYRRCLVTDAGGNSKVITVAVTSEKPDKILIDGSGSVDSTIETTQGQIMTGLHKFILVKGNRPVGGCALGCAWEKIWKLSDPEPTNWMHEGCNSTQSPGFYFAAPIIYDYRAYQIPSPTFWAGKQVGDFVFERYQRLRVVVPDCNQATPTIVESERLKFQVIKKSATQVTFKVVVSP